MQDANRPTIPNLTAAALPAEPILLGAAVLPLISEFPPQCLRCSGSAFSTRPVTKLGYRRDKENGNRCQTIEVQADLSQVSAYSGPVIVETGVFR
jgi:hypothetical protein